MPSPQPPSPGLQPRKEVVEEEVRARHHPKGHSDYNLCFSPQARLSGFTTPTPTPKKSFPGIWGGLFEMLTTPVCIRYCQEELLSVSPGAKGLQVLVKGIVSPEELN